MTVTKTLKNDTLTVAVEGWIDTLTAQQYHEALQDLEGAKNVVLDFSSVEYVSSAGLRETVALYRAVCANGGTFSIRRVNPDVLKVFQLTGFDKKFDILSD